MLPPRAQYIGARLAAGTAERNVEECADQSPHCIAVAAGAEIENEDGMAGVAHALRGHPESVKKPGLADAGFVESRQIRTALASPLTSTSPTSSHSIWAETGPRTASEISVYRYAARSCKCEPKFTESPVT